MKKLLLALVAVASSASALAQSAVPNLMSYQSRVADAAGVPLGNTTPVNRIVLFRIYDSPNLSAPANRLYSEQQTVTIAAGEFSVLIGSGTAISTETTNAFSTLSSAVFGGSTRYLGVTVDDGDGNPLNDPEMSPRQQIVGTPFAFRAQTAEAVALGGVNALSLANNSVTTAAIAPGAITSEKIAADGIPLNSVDGSKIVDSSITLADLHPSLVAVMPKPSVTYDQGLGAFVKNAAVATHQFTVFPIDANDLGVDGEVLISYYGSKKSGLSSTAVAEVPALFTGQLRIIVPNFIGGNGANGITGTATASNIYVGNTGAAVAAPATNIPFIAYHQGYGTANTYSVTGFLNSTTATTTIVSPPTTIEPNIPTSWLFPRTMGQWYIFYIDGGNNLLNPPIYNGNYGTFFTTPPLAHASAYKRQTSPNNGISVPVSAAPYHSISGATQPMFHITHYYPGGDLAGISTAPFNTTQTNNSANANAGGPPQTLSVASIQTGTNKLTLTTTTGHVVQEGDTVVLASVTGAPSANGTFTVSAVPSPTSFEIPLTGASGGYTGGTVTHTPRYNKYRLWVSVHASVNVRVIVSDK